MPAETYKNIMNNTNNQNLDFQAGPYQVHILGAGKKNVPVIYINTIPGEYYVLWTSCLQAHMDDFILVGIDQLNWCTDLAPWYCEPSGPTDTACYGGAEAYLKVLCEQIIPEAEKRLGFPVEHRFLAGYSLAGLFAVWSMYHTDLFERMISGSGSFWFPDFDTYAKEHQLVRKPLSIYFSLGKEESHTAYPIFNTVQVRTDWLYHWYQDMGIDTTLVMEPGDHYTDPWSRMCRGIAWTLSQMSASPSIQQKTEDA